MERNESLPLRQLPSQTMLLTTMASAAIGSILTVSPHRQRRSIPPFAAIHRLPRRQRQRQQQRQQQRQRQQQQRQQQQRQRQSLYQKNFEIIAERQAIGWNRPRHDDVDVDVDVVPTTSIPSLQSHGYRKKKKKKKGKHVQNSIDRELSPILRDQAMEAGTNARSSTFEFRKAAVDGPGLKQRKPKKANKANEWNQRQNNPRKYWHLLT